MISSDLSRERIVQLRDCLALRDGMLQWIVISLLLNNARSQRVCVESVYDDFGD